jgi:hypothetical protein
MNLLQETIEILTLNGKGSQDVLWVGDKTHKTTWDNFENVADVEYNAGYGSVKVALDLIVVGIDWWLERNEYDGSEGWEYKETPKMLEDGIDLKAVTIDQAKKLGYDVSCGWETLARINGFK